MEWYKWILLACYLFSLTAFCVELFLRAKRAKRYCEPSAGAWLLFAVVTLIGFLTGAVMAAVMLLPSDNMVSKWLAAQPYVVDAMLAAGFALVFGAAPVAMTAICRRAYRNFEPLFLRVTVTVLMWLIGGAFFAWMLSGLRWCDGCGQWH